MQAGFFDSCKTSNYNLMDCPNFNNRKINSIPEKKDQITQIKKEYSSYFDETLDNSSNKKGDFNFLKLILLSSSIQRLELENRMLRKKINKFNSEITKTNIENPSFVEDEGFIRIIIRFKEKTFIQI